MNSDDLTDSLINKLIEDSIDVSIIVLTLSPAGPIIAARNHSCVWDSLPKEVQADLEDAIKVGVRAISEVLQHSKSFGGGTTIDLTRAKAAHEANEQRTAHDDDDDFFKGAVTLDVD